MGCCSHPRITKSRQVTDESIHKFVCPSKKVYQNPESDYKCQEQTMENNILENQQHIRKKANQLICLQKENEIIYNKDDLNVIEDQFFEHHLQKPIEAENANNNSDDDY